MLKIAELVFIASAFQCSATAPPPEIILNVYEANRTTKIGTMKLGESVKVDPSEKVYIEAVFPKGKPPCLSENSQIHKSLVDPATIKVFDKHAFNQPSLKDMYELNMFKGYERLALFEFHPDTLALMDYNDVVLGVKNVGKKF